MKRAVRGGQKLLFLSVLILAVLDLSNLAAGQADICSLVQEIRFSGNSLFSEQELLAGLKFSRPESQWISLFG